MTPEIESLPIEYRQLLELAGESLSLDFLLLDELSGGRTDAHVYLASVTPQGETIPQHLILKLDRLPTVAAPDEIERHRQARELAPSEFASRHMPELAYELKHDGYLAVFYAIAGQSLLQYHPLSSFRRQSQLEAIFRQAQDLLLDGWNAAATFEQAVPPQVLLERWLTRRIMPGGPVARFLQETCRLAPAIPGFLIQSQVYPNPLAYANRPDLWDGTRPLDVLTGFQHGDLNIRNLLVKFGENQVDLEGSFLIDFALFKPGMPLFYDQHYLEMSYLLRELEALPLARWVELVAQLAGNDTPDPRQVPVELAGACAVLNAGRLDFREWVNGRHTSLGDDLWAQYWLGGVAAGLNFCAKRDLPERERLAGLIFAAVHLKRCCDRLGLAAPGEVKLLYPAQPAWETPGTSVSAVPGPLPPLPGGLVTFLFSDIEGSTRLWQAYPVDMPESLAQHDALVLQAVSGQGGMVFKRLGDGVCAAFPTASGALGAALEAQRLLQAAEWGPTGEMKVRMGLHSGSIQPEGGDYLGTPVNQAARLMGVACGGQVLVSQATLDLLQGSPPANLEWLDLGEHWLKDLVQPLHIWQPVTPGLPSVFPPLPTVRLQEQSVPEYATPLVGRRREIAEIGRLLQEHRLVTICGPGGMGKTRLALVVAEELRAAYRQGAIFVPLLSHDSPSAIVPAIAQALGISFLEGRPPQEQLLEAMRARQVLIVLDNLEHLLVKEKSTATLALVEALLEAAPGLRLLVTSRELLRLPQEQAYLLEGLPVAASDALVPPTDDSAVQLFCLRAQRLLPDCTLDGENDLRLVRSICRAVDGMPLAIELAAAQLRLLSLEEIAGQVERSLDVLDTSLRGVGARHQGIRLVFAGTWQGLEESERLAFARLSVFEGGFTLQSASRVAGATLRDLTALVDKSLVARSPGGRMTCHALIQRFAAEKLAELPGEQEAARAAHHHYYNDLLANSAQRWETERDLSVLDALRPEADNLRLACSWMLERRDWPAFTTYMDGLWVFYRSQGRLPEAMELLERAIAAGKTESTAGGLHLAHWELLLGKGYEWQSQLVEGDQHSRRALEALGYPLPSGKTAIQLEIARQLLLQLLHHLFPFLFFGKMKSRQPEIVEALHAYQNLFVRAFLYNDQDLATISTLRMLNLSESANQASWMSLSYAAFGIALTSPSSRFLGNYYLRLAESNSRLCTSREVLCWYSILMGYYSLFEGHWDQSVHHYTRAGELADQLDQAWVKGNAWVGLLWLNFLRGEYERSLDCAAWIGESARRRGDIGFIAAADYWQALICVRRGSLQAVEPLLQASFSAPPSVMNPFDWMIVWTTLALTFLNQGDLGKALEQADKFVLLVEESPSVTNGMFLYGFFGVARVYLAAWEAHYSSDACPDPGRMAQKLCRDLEKAARIFPIDRASALLTRGCCDWLNGSRKKARSAWLECVSVSEAAGLPYEMGLAHYELGRHLAEGEFLVDGSGRIEHLQHAARIFTDLGTVTDLERVNAELQGTYTSTEQSN